MTPSTMSLDEINVEVAEEKLRNAEIAEKVMGWKWWVSSGTGRRCIYAPGRNPDHMKTPATGAEQLVGDWEWHYFTPRFTTDPAADYSVLVELCTRDYDTRERFWYALCRIWDNRRVAADPHTVSSHPNVAMYYLVGDYSRAALEALGQSRGEETNTRSNQ